MPIYEYQCEKCGETAEVLQKFSDEPLSQCPHCGGHMSKLMSMNSFQLKGSGWYVTDYAGKSGQAAAKKDCGEKGACCGGDSAVPDKKADSACKACEKSSTPSA